jgi:hypothetical protein
VMAVSVPMLLVSTRKGARCDSGRALNRSDDSPPPTMKLAL